MYIRVHSGVWIEEKSIFETYIDMLIKSCNLGLKFSKKKNQSFSSKPCIEPLNWDRSEYQCREKSKFFLCKFSENRIKNVPLIWWRKVNKNLKYKFKMQSATLFHLWSSSLCHIFEKMIIILQNLWIIKNSGTTKCSS